MRVYVTRHGQTNLNHKSLMQGLTDEPLNETGETQALETREKVKDIHFDAVFASPLIRARKTASLIADIPMEEVQVDERIIELDFGPYELKPYTGLGLKMTLFWLLPEVFPSPKGVETIPHASERIKSFFEDLKTKDYENVLIVCHGGIIRVICGYLLNRKNGIQWRPKPQNCEVREFVFHN